LNWLNQIGCHTLKALKNLPRAGLSRRTHPDVLHQLDQAYGATPEQYTWFQPTAVFSKQLNLNTPLTQAPTLLFFATRLIQQLVGWLAQRQLACTQLLFTLHHQSSHNNQPSTPFLLQFSSGVRHANNLLEVLQAKLPSIPLPAPVTAISLQVKYTQPP